MTKADRSTRVFSLKALHDVAVAASGFSDEGTLSQLVVDRAREVAGGDAAVLRWFEPASNSFRLLAATGVPRLPVEAIDAESRTSIAEAFRTGKPVIMNGYSASAHATLWGLTQGVRAQVAVPLVVDHRPVGTLAVLSTGRRRFSPAHAEAMSLLAAIIAPALEAARLQDEVRRQHDRIAEIYEAVPAMIVVFDRDGRAIYTNRAAITSMGGALEGIRTRTLPLYREDGTLVAPEERPTAIALATKKAVRGAVVAIGDVEKRWFVLDVVPILDEDGEVDVLVTSSSEITSLKQAEAARRDSERLFTTAFQASGLGMALADVEGRLMRVNGALCELLGKREADLVGTEAIALAAADDVSIARARLSNLGSLPESSVATVTVRLRHGAGRLVWGRITCSLIRREGEATHVLMHVVDVTEEKRAQAILQAEQWRLGEIVETLRELSGSELELDRLLKALAERTVRLAGTGAVAVLLPEGDRMVVRASAGAPGIPDDFSVPMDSSLAGATYRSGVLQRSSLLDVDPRAHAPTARGGGVSAAVSAPLVRNGVVIGVVQLMSPQPDAFDETDVRTLEMVTGFAAAAFERATTTRRLRTSEQRTRAVIETAPDPIAIFDSEGNLVDFNPAAEHAFQRTRESVMGRSGALLISPRHTEGFQRWIANGRRAGSAEYAGRRFETVGLRADGSEFPMEVAVANLPEEIQLGAAFIRDLTLRDRLKESSEQLAAVVGSAPVIVIAFDRKAVATVAMGQALGRFDMTPESLVGTDLREMMKDYPDIVAGIDRLLRGESMSDTFHLTQSDRYVEMFFSPTFDQDGAVSGGSGVVTDVTDRVRAEEAQRQSEAKSRVMAMMNHEVRTPLNAILGFAQLLTDSRVGDLTEKQARYVSNIKTAGNHLLQLVNESLDLAKLDAGQASMELRLLDSGAVLAAAAEQLRPLADARGLTVSVDASPAVSVYADQRHLLQVVLNLLSNAIRHTESGGTIRLAASESGEMTRISVADTGAGISREDLKRIFEEFYQAGNHAPGGAGLGLSISKRLVTHMCGTITAESELGRGSVFTVELPARAPDQA